MSSLRRVQSSKANGALSKGPSTPAGKQRSSLNALRHGLCAKCIVLDHESRENFLTLLQQHVDRFQPANEVEFGMIEEMCASYWRQRRAWAIETALLDKQIALQPEGSNAGRMAAAFDHLAAAPTLPLLHRYETRLHTMYQRALRTFILLRTAKIPNDPDPISEHPLAAVEPPPPPQPPTDSEALSGASFSLPKAPPQPSPGALHPPARSANTGCNAPASAAGDLPPVTPRAPISNTAPRQQSPRRCHHATERHTHANTGRATRAHVNRTHNNRAPATRAHTTRAPATRAHTTRAHINPIHINRAYTTRAHTNRVHINRAHATEPCRRWPGAGPATEPQPTEPRP